MDLGLELMLKLLISVKSFQYVPYKLTSKQFEGILCLLDESLPSYILNHDAKFILFFIEILQR